MFAAVAATLHGAAIWLLLPHGALRPGAESPPFYEVELVDQAPKVRGAAPAAPAPTQPPPTPRTPPPPPEPDAALPMPPPPQPQPTSQAPPGPPTPAQPTAQASPRSPEVNLANDDEDQEGLRVTGARVVPARPDALFHNKPPSYPIEAVRRHAEGTVALKVHVTENGTPGWVDVTSSSGDPSLDQSAQDAVALWRFQPAREHGVPVAIDVPMTFSFSIGRPARALP